MDLGWVSAFALFLTAALVALGSIFVLAALQGDLYRPADRIFADLAGGASFLFDGETLVDATPQARALLADGVGDRPWPRMIAALNPHFPQLEAELTGLPDRGTMTLVADGEDKPTLLRAELRGGLTRISLHGDPRQGAMETLALKTRQDELRHLREILAQAPLPIWREREDGAVIWANSRYLNEVADRLPPGQDLAWPLPRLFDEASRVPGKIADRHRLSGPSDQSQWFDLHHADPAGLRASFALPADALIRSELAQADYKRVITGTFANLPIGLAIFDNRRHLVQFNPALVDLSRLPTDFLLTRPTIFGLLDALRDSNMIPEPKDYRAWCKRLTEARTPDSHEEIWTLPTGQTWRLTGRPYPDGALALMFEDISTEVSHIRRYRAEIELGQSVLDAMDEAVAVFSPAGQLILTNRRYVEMWRHAPAETVLGGTLCALLDHWQSLSAPAPLWSEAEAFLAAGPGQGPLCGEVALPDGGHLNCHFSHLPGQHRLARFRIGAGVAQIPMAETTEPARQRVG